MASVAAASNQLLPDAGALDEADIRADWLRRRPLLEFLAAQPGGCYWICEDAGRLAGYVRVVQFEGYEELTELEVETSHQGQGIGRALLERCWPGDPSPDMGRLVVSTGAPASLSLFTDFGVMPVAGHWLLRQATAEYLQARARELTDAAPTAVSVLEHERALAEWKRLEPAALGHPRPALHDFFGRERTCLAYFDERSGEPVGLAWVSGNGEIGPAVGARPEDLVPVVLAALDRVARSEQPEHLTVYATSIAWWLLRRLRSLGFKVHLPTWIMCSEPIPGLDRYVPTQPSQLL